MLYGVVEQMNSSTRVNATNLPKALPSQEGLKTEKSLSLEKKWKSY